MISYLEGKIILKAEKYVILNVNSVGYKVFLSQKALNKIPQEGENHKFFCYLNVKEKGLELYGFPAIQELESFESLIDLPSIGPKAALEISSLGPIEKIKEALEREDEKVIKEIFNVGKKKAQIIILELSRKIKHPPKEKNISEDETFQALLKLGFSRQKIKEALSRVPKGIQDPGKKIKEALNFLGK
jgi:Holliday junction DNA helicase RuvA